MIFGAGFSGSFFVKGKKEEMKLENYKQLKNFVDSSDLVLIGLGQEWIVSYDEMYMVLKKEEPVIAQLLDVAVKNERFSELLKIVEWYFYCYSQHIPERLRSAYQSLYELVNQKNYFIVSLTVDSYLERFHFNNDRCVNPCGSYIKMQCESCCEQELMDSELVLTPIMAILSEITEKNDCISQEGVIKYADILLEATCNLKCKKCHERIVFNTLDAVKYNENGYLDKWQIYMKWLQGTVNRNTCIIEAGAGMELPSVIRWPFEKTTFYNKKATMVRIHHKFYQVNEEVADRAYGMEKNSVDFFCQK